MTLCLCISKIFKQTSLEFGCLAYFISQCLCSCVKLILNNIYIYIQGQAGWQLISADKVSYIYINFVVLNLQKSQPMNKRTIIQYMSTLQSRSNNLDRLNANEECLQPEKLLMKITRSLSFSLLIYLALQFKF